MIVIFFIFLLTRLKGICVVKGETDNFLLYINMTSFPLIPNFLLKYSVIPICCFLNKNSFITGQFIIPRIFFSFINFKAHSNDLKIYLFDLVDVFSKADF